jgi:hypothetical protein
MSKGYKPRKTSEAPTSTRTCEQCETAKPAYGFTSLGSGDGKASKSLCSVCYNRWHTKRSGMAELADVELPPLALSDSFGKEHTFYFDVRLSRGLGIRAFELIDGVPGGYQFSIMEHPETPVKEVHARLVKRIREGLSVHYLESSDSGPAQNRLYLKGSAINGRIEERGQEMTPVIVIDGQEYSWEELGQFVSSHMGFNFRLETFDPYDDSIPTDPDPTREDRLWWLPKPGDDSENSGKERRTYQ